MASTATPAEVITPNRSNSSMAGQASVDARVHGSAHAKRQAGSARRVREDGPEARPQRPECVRAPRLRGALIIVERNSAVSGSQMVSCPG